MMSYSKKRVVFETSSSLALSAKILLNIFFKNYDPSRLLPSADLHCNNNVSYQRCLKYL